MAGVDAWLPRPGLEEKGAERIYLSRQAKGSRGIPKSGHGYGLRSAQQQA